MSILAKLMLLAALPAVLATLVVGIALERRQHAQWTARLEEKLERYASLGAEQVQSAVAYNDRETAREVLGAIGHDAEVVGIQLYDEHGRALDDRGFHVPEAHIPSRGLPFKLHGNLVLAVPVIPDEGPTGTLVISVTTSHAAEEQLHARTLTVAVGGVAVLLSIALAYLIARGLSRRIRAVEQVANRVAAGDLHVPPLADPGTDELGRTATSVNQMLGHLNELIATRMVLDHVIQGLAIVDTAGTIVGETSAAMTTLVGDVGKGDPLWAALPPRAQESLALNFSQLAQGVLPFELLIDQLPSELAVGEKTLALRYTPLPDDRLLVAITDVTEQRASEIAREAEAEVAALFHAFKADRHVLRRFVDDARLQLAAIAHASDPFAMLAPLHTLKGNAALLHLDAWAARAHAAESAIVELGELTAEQAEALVRAWQATETRLAPFLTTSDSVEIAPRDYARLIDLGRDLPELRRLLDDIQLEPAARPLGRLGAHCSELAIRRGRSDLRVVVDDGGVRLDPVLWNPLWSVLVHVARNAVTHGMPADRAGEIRLCARRDRDFTVIEIADRGDGVRWDDLAQRARERGLPNASHDDLVDAMFSPQLSTVTAVDEVAGRGVGLSAVADICDALGVIYDVESGNHGTTFRFWLPRMARRLTCVS